MSIARHHTEWLSLVPVSGPFLSLPVLLEAFNTGLEPHDPEHFRLLRQAYSNWLESFEKRKADPAAHHQWINFVLTRTLDLDGQILVEGQTIPQTLHVEVPEHHELLRPSIVLTDPNTKKPRLLIQVYPRSQELNSYVVNSSWKASPDTRMANLLHGSGVRLGLITNGEHWMLVDAPKGETTGYSSWYASLWLEEQITLRAFRSLLSVSRFFNVPDDQTLEALLTKSASNQQEVTEQLGYQVRRAVEMLISDIAKIEHEPLIDKQIRELIAAIPPTELYESALTVMMRLVFLFCAEERELIPSKPFPVYEENYSVSTISKQLRELADQLTEDVLERRTDAWPRLLAAFRSVYGGLKHDDVHIPAYGGSLFNPDRFPFLEGRKPKTSWLDTSASPLPVNNRTVLHLLEALQFLETKVPGSNEKTLRRLSFRALDIEQIGHVYEGLLDHTAKRATEPYLGLIGNREKEPEIPLAELEKHQAKSQADLIKFLKEETGKQEKALTKLLNEEFDVLEANRFRTVCQNDETLWKRVKPFAGLVRLDSFDYPVVIPRGSVFVTAGTDRRSSGTHYTPRSLTEPIVQYTLEPLVYIGPAEGKPKSEWKLKLAKELLELKICDMACGSGAFLVQAARYMAERLLEAWDEAKKANPNMPGITPEGMPSTGKTNEVLIPDDPTERKTYAMRIIAQRCLHGVDINPLAAEMAKLSLWLLTLAKDKPFEFLDHSIRCGDSLVGLHDIQQLKNFSLKEDDKIKFEWPGEFEEPVDAAINLRLKLEDMPANTAEDVKQQEKLLLEANEKMARLRCAADLLVAAEFWSENAKDKLERSRHAAVKAGHYIEREATEEFEQLAVNERRGQKMFHWPLEFPEVIVKRNGFDAFLGNPPFMGGSFVSGRFGSNYRAFLISHLSQRNKGNADLCAYFVLLAFNQLRPNGTAGLLTTNTISEGDTRETALQSILDSDGIVYAATSSAKWPGQATLHISHLWLTNSKWRGPRILDGKVVETISSFLRSEDVNFVSPFRLEAQSGYGLEGSHVNGMGFILEPEEAAELIEGDDSCRDVILQFLNGEDLNESYQQLASRWIINFWDWPLRRMSKNDWEVATSEERKLLEKSGNVAHNYPGKVAADYPTCLEIVKARVWPERKDKANESLRRLWWRFKRPTLELYDALKESKRVLVCSEVTKHLSFCFVQKENVFSANLAVFPRANEIVFSILQSTIHELWARSFCSHLETRLKYSQGNGFENFPFHTKYLDLINYSLSKSFSDLLSIGSTYHDYRQNLMIKRQHGLTVTYNLFHNTNESIVEIQKLRELHIEMDYLVAKAYGWTDLALGHDFHETKQGVRFTISGPARREVLQRLLNLNHERYAEEVKQGLHDKKGAAKKSTPKKATAVTVSMSPTLFDMDDDASFPSNKREEFLCGLLCDLVAANPGQPTTEYMDELVIALGHKAYKRLLVGSDQTKFTKLCKSIPKAQSAGKAHLPWSDLLDVLKLRKAVIPSENSTLQIGTDFELSRKSYPSVLAELIQLIQKAGATLRDHQNSALQNSEVVQVFNSDRQLLCEASS